MRHFPLPFLAPRASASARGEVVKLEAALNVAQRHYSTVQWELATGETKRKAYRGCFDAQQQRHQELEALLGGICSPLVDRSSLIDSVHDLLSHGVYCSLNTYMQWVLQRFANALSVFVPKFQAS